METKNLFDLDVYQGVLDRIESLQPSAQPAWGKMDAAQMLAHCAEVIDVANGKPLKGTPWFVKPFKGFIKAMVVNDKPFPKNIRTHPQYLMVEPEDFTRQKERLLLSLKAMIALGKVETNHPFFGKMSADEKGRAMHKHLDHHLAQFGV